VTVPQTILGENGEDERLDSRRTFFWRWETRTRYGSKTSSFRDEEKERGKHISVLRRPTFDREKPQREDMRSSV
jgi:hypothetical protein